VIVGVLLGVGVSVGVGVTVGVGVMVGVGVIVGVGVGVARNSWSGPQLIVDKRARAKAIVGKSDFWRLIIFLLNSMQNKQAQHVEG
jgi:hypothetical protein